MIAGLVVGVLLFLAGAGLLLTLRQGGAPSGPGRHRSPAAAARRTPTPAPRPLPRPIQPTQRIPQDADAVNAAIRDRITAGLPPWTNADTAVRRPDDTVRLPRYTEGTP